MIAVQTMTPIPAIVFIPHGRVRDAEVTIYEDVRETAPDDRVVLRVVHAGSGAVIGNIAFERAEAGRLRDKVDAFLNN